MCKLCTSSPGERAPPRRARRQRPRPRPPPAPSLHRLLGAVTPLDPLWVLIHAVTPVPPGQDLGAWWTASVASPWVGSSH